MKLAVVGGRDFNNWELLVSEINRLRTLYPIDQLISGGASGADAFAERYAELAKLPIKVLPADWKSHGRAAGPIRNKQIIELSDAVLAFWDGSSPGTKSSIDWAVKLNKPYIIVKY